MSTYPCKQCGVEHVRISSPVQPEPEPFRHLAADFAVVLLVIGSVLFWIASQA